MKSQIFLAQEAANAAGMVAAGYANNSYMGSVENLNTFIFKLNNAVRAGMPPPGLRFVLWGLTMLCFFGFALSSFITVVALDQSPSIGGIIACFIGFALFGIFLPQGLGYYYHNTLMDGLQRAISSENQIATPRGYHW